MKGRLLCTLLGAAGRVVGLSLATERTMSADASFREHASLRLTSATPRAQEASPALVGKLGRSFWEAKSLRGYSIRCFGVARCRSRASLSKRAPSSVSARVQFTGELRAMSRRSGVAAEEDNHSDISLL